MVHIVYLWSTKSNCRGLVASHRLSWKSKRTQPRWTQCLMVRDSFYQISACRGLFLLPERLTDKYETWNPLQWETSKMLSSRCSSWYLPSSTSLEYRPFRVSWLWQRQSRGKWRLFLEFSDLEAPYGPLACLWKKVTAFLWASPEKTKW